MDMTCRNTSTGAEHNISAPAFVTGERDYTQGCPSGEVGTGLQIRYGDHVNAVGLICNTFKKPAPLPLIACRGGGAMRVEPAYGPSTMQFGVVGFLVFQIGKGSEPGPGECVSTNGQPIGAFKLGITGQTAQLQQGPNPAVRFTVAGPQIADFILAASLVKFEVAKPPEKLTLVTCQGSPNVATFPPTSPQAMQMGVIGIVQFAPGQPDVSPGPGQCTTMHGGKLPGLRFGFTGQQAQIFAGARSNARFTIAGPQMGDFILVTGVQDFEMPGVTPPKKPPEKLTLVTCQGSPSVATFPVASLQAIQMGVVAIVQFSPGQPGVPPGPGQCTTLNGGQLPGLRYGFTGQFGQVLAGARSNATFTIAGPPMGDFILVTGVQDFEMPGVTPPKNPPPFNPPPMNPPPVINPGNGGMPPPMGMGPCGGGDGAMAVVEIADPKLHYLNVRNEPNGKIVLGKLPEGTTVSVMGSCDGKPAAGIVASSKKIGGTPGWCQISLPIDGCVAERFLAFGGDASAGMGMPPPPPPPPAPMMPRFSGDWSAEAEGFTYAMTFQQMGPTVTGTYNGSDGSSGTLKGKIVQGELHFSWVQGDGLKGTGKFRLSDDGQSFEGSYSLSDDDDQVDGVWTGSRN
jgi:hypothetical protein